MGCQCSRDETADQPAEPGTTYALVQGRRTLFASSDRQNVEAVVKDPRRQPLGDVEIREIPPRQGDGPHEG